MMKRLDFAKLGSALLCSALLAACATKLPRPAAAPEPAPLALLSAASARGLDQFRTRLGFTLRLENPRSSPLVLGRYSFRLEIEGIEAGRAESWDSRSVAAGGSVELPLEFEVDLRELEAPEAGSRGRATGSSMPATAGFHASALLELRGADGQPISLNASTQGSFPIVREPELRILGLAIERDILVTTKLRLAIEVYNPNAFPVELRGLAYDFFGEGRIWSGGTDDRVLAVPALSARRTDLAFELNFADRDRSLFDLVAQLKAVRYGLKGTGRVETGLDFLPEFRLSFDEEGSCQVER